jgi:hypothetical protein
LYNLHVISDVGEDGWLDEEALVTVTISTSLDGSTGIFALLDVAGKIVSIETLMGSI